MTPLSRHRYNRSRLARVFAPRNIDRNAAGISANGNGMNTSLRLLLLARDPAERVQSARRELEQILTG